MKMLIVVLGLILAITLVGALLAFPTMLLINAIFGPSFIGFVFGTSQITFLKAWGVNILAGSLFGSRSISTSK